MTPEPFNTIYYPDKLQTNKVEKFSVIFSMKKAGMWIKLERGNDWGAEYFGLPGKSRSSYGTCSIREFGLKFEEGGKIKIRWPDGKESTETIKHKNMHATVSDHGHETTVNYGLAGFEVKVHGVPSWFPLDVVEIWHEDK